MRPKLKLPTIKVLNELVIAEATKLKKFATKKEIDKLFFEQLDTMSQDSCIYGQMTGNCFHLRAVELIELSCTKVLTRIDDDRDEIIGSLNGSPKGIHRSSYWSPIEMFIDRKRNKDNGNNKRLIDFIKGETKTLKLK